MSIRRILALAAVVPLVAGVAAADAATARKPKPPKPVCNLVTDPKDDGTDTGGSGASAPNDPTFDILSADVATNATTVTVAFRLSSVDWSTSNWPLGHAFVFSFTPAGGRTVDIRGIVSQAGNKTPAGGTLVVDTAKKEVRVSVPISGLASPVKNGQKLTDLRASAWRWVGTTDGTAGYVDRAGGAVPYTAGALSCVKVGA